jgi:hypothetical protein
MSMFRRSNDIEVSISPGKRPFTPESIAAGDVAVRSSRTARSRSWWKATRGIRRRTGRFDGDWLSPPNRTRTEPFDHLARPSWLVSPRSDLWADRSGISIKRPGRPANDSFRPPGEDARGCTGPQGVTDAIRR